MNNITLTEELLDQKLQEVYNRGCRDMYELLQGKRKEEEEAPVTAQEIADDYGLHLNTVLGRIKDRHIEKITKRPVSIARRHIIEVVKAA